jgi:hypothetical protein
MMIKELLLQKKEVIIEKWIQSIFDTYPEETSDFLRLQKNKFSNPVGNIICEAARKIFDAILSGNQALEIKILLNDLIKVRAVQDFLPSKAAGFIFSLKNIIKEEIQQNIADIKSFNEFCEVLFGIDRVALIAFDLYSEAREKVYQLRMNELKNNIHI